MTCFHSNISFIRHIFYAHFAVLKAWFEAFKAWFEAFKALVCTLMYEIGSPYQAFYTTITTFWIEGKIKAKNKDKSCLLVVCAGAVLVSQWVQPWKRMSLSWVSGQLDTIADMVRTSLQSQAPNHPACSKDNSEKGVRYMIILVISANPNCCL